MLKKETQEEHNTSSVASISIVCNDSVAVHRIVEEYLI